MKGVTRALVDPGVRERVIAKYTWIKARKAYCISEVPVPQTDTGR